MSSEPGPDERATVEIHIVPHNYILWWVRPYEASLIFRDQIRMKAVEEDEELLCIVWAKTGDVSGHTILRNGSTHSYINPIKLALGHVEAIFIHKHEYVRGLVSFQFHYSLQ